MFPSEAPQLIKYWEIVKDIAATDSAIGYFTMSNFAFYCKLLLNDKYPSDEVHWELWLKVTFRGQPSPSTGNKPQVIDHGSTSRQFRKEHVGLFTK